MYGCKSSCHISPVFHRRTGPLAPRDNHSLAEGHWFFRDHCLLSTALTRSVPCTPMPMVSSVDKVQAVTRAHYRLLHSAAHYIM